MDTTMETAPSQPAPQRPEPPPQEPAPGRLELEGEEPGYGHGV